MTKKGILIFTFAVLCLKKKAQIVSSQLLLRTKLTGSFVKTVRQVKLSVSQIFVKKKNNLISGQRF